MSEFPKTLSRVELQRWLVEQDDQIALKLAARAALRELPSWSVYCRTARDRRSHLTEMPIFRAGLFVYLAALNNKDFELKDSGSNVFADAKGAYLDSDRFLAERVSFAVKAVSKPPSRKRHVLDSLSLRGERGKALWADMEALNSGFELSEIPLWPGPYKGVQKNDADDWNAIRKKHAVAGGELDFWVRWYKSLTNPGEFARIPDLLLKKIALLHNDLWSGVDAPRKIAAEIERLEEQFQLLGAVREAREDAAAAKRGFADRATRSSNLPDDLEPLEIDVEHLSQIEAELEAAERELEKDRPSSEAIGRIARKLRAATLLVGKYVGLKLDLALNEATKEITKWGVRVSVGIFLLKAQEIAEWLARFADKFPF